jgi:hypothetical protein
MLSYGILWGYLECKNKLFFEDRLLDWNTMFELVLRHLSFWLKAMDASFSYTS